MNINKIINRVKNILTTPKSEWPVIANETTTVTDLYKNWIIWLAAIPAVAGFIKSSLIGYGAFGFTIRTSIGVGINSALFGYALSLLLVYVMALIINALAPTFSAQKNPIQALKTAAYAWTAIWIANIGLILPWIGLLFLLAGLIYSIYLLYLGLPATMKCPPEKTAGYTALSFVCALVLGWIVMVVVAGITSVGGGTLMGSAPGSVRSDTTFEKNSWLGKMEVASKQMEAAEKSGDADAQAKALQAMMGAALGGGDQVESLPPDVLRPFVPETLAGLQRTNFSAERNSAMGLQMSTAKASYSDGNDRSLRLEITDTGSMKGVMGLAGWAAMQSEKETDRGYDKTYKQGGRFVREEWDNQSKRGKYGIVLGNRFLVEVSGKADSMNELKAVVASLHLAGLEALKNQGVKKN
ncbi:MAG: YIP1 family protein [Burkholderiales bacterium]|jgi:hypothetical protein|nr:YIP1 family protein [Burkholderiales bacterium]